MSFESNPFRIDDKPGRDTRHVVRSVLMFMAQSFEVMEGHKDVWLNDACAGASHILFACVSALKEREEGGDDAD